MGLEGRTRAAWKRIRVDGDAVRANGVLQPTFVSAKIGMPLRLDGGLIRIDDLQFGDRPLAVKGRIERSSAKIGPFAVAGFDTRFTWKDDRIELNRLGGRLYGGKINPSRTMFHAGSATGGPFRVELSASKVRLEDVIREVGGRAVEQSSKGLVNVRLEGSGRLADRASWKGEGVARVSGRLYELPLLARVVGVLNLDFLTQAQGAQTGLFEFDVADEIIKFGRAFVKGPAINLDGSGTLTFDGETDFVFEPDFIKWIDGVSIVGDILDLPRRLFLSTVRVTGPISSPKTTLGNIVTEVLPDGTKTRRSADKKSDDRKNR